MNNAVYHIQDKSVAQFLSDIPCYWMIPDGRGHWMQNGELRYWSAKLQREFIIPHGSINDLSSIPGLLQSFIPVNGDNRMGAGPHDYWFQKEGDLPEGKITRREANIMYKEILSIHRPLILQRFSIELVSLLKSTEEGRKILDRMAEDKPLVGIIGRNALYSGLKAGSWIHW